MRLRKTALALLAALLCLSGVCLAAEDMRFVDANGATGYYVDVNSLSFEGEQAVNARVAMVKALANRMYVYRMRFDRGKGTYQTLSAEVRAYDTKEVLSRDGEVQAPRPYGVTSPMRAMVDFIYEYADANAKKK